MSFLDYINQLDREILIFLNNLGNENWDAFWLNVTNKYVWIPLYLVVIFLFFKHFGWKKMLFTLFMVALLVTFSDQLSNLFKETFERLRPNKDPSINTLIRVLKNSGGYSFFSAHASTSFAVSIFIILSLKKFFKLIFLILIWPLLFAYSRIYLGVHYPMDVLCGSIMGIIVGWFFYKINHIFLSKIN